MITKYRRWIVLVLALAVVAWIKLFPSQPPGAGNPRSGSTTAATSHTPPVARRLGSVAFTPCTLAPEFGLQSIEAQCSSLQVPEDHAHPEGRKITLALAWLPAKGEAEPDPMLMLAGGPGQSALETFPGIAPAFADVRKKRNIVLVDQRGTGGSNTLSCKDNAGKNAVMDDDEDSLAGATAFAARCVAELSKKADLRFYTTTDAIQDLEAVRRAIGAAQLNLIGISYGTRVAQQYAKRYPAQRAHDHHRRHRAQFPGAGQRVRAQPRGFARPAVRAAAARTPPAPASSAIPARALHALMTRLAADPPLVTYRDAITGESQPGQAHARPRRRR